MYFKNSEVINTIILGSILFLVLVFIIIWAAVKFYNSKKERRQLEISFEQELLKSKLEIQEQTLKLISQEIHDNIGQVLSLVKLNIAKIDPFDHVSVGAKIDDARSLLTKAIQDLRDLSKRLNADFAKDIGLRQAVEYELSLLERTGSFKTSCVIQGAPITIDPQKELIIFRIFQELINNIIKHANADMIDVKLTYESTMFRLVVVDNGNGFDLVKMNLAKSDGLGLRNINNRAALIGGSFSLQSSPGDGTTSVVTLALEFRKV